MMKNQKNQLLRVATLFVILALLAGCTRSIQPEPLDFPPTSTVLLPETLPATNTVEVTPTTAPTNTPKPTPTVYVPEDLITSYEFSALLDYNKHTLDVNQSIQYTNNTGQDLSELVLVVPPNQKEDIFELDTLSVEGSVQLAEQTLDGISLTLSLASPLAALDSIKIDMHYLLNLEFNGGILGYTKKQTNLSDWYPFVAPYDPDLGWMVNQPAEVGEYLVYDAADFTLMLAVFGKEGLIVAGSTEVVPLDIDIYQMNAQNSRNITFSVSDQYQVLTKEFGNTIVRGYVFAGDETAGWAALENSGNALLLFSTLFGIPYPHKTLTVVESDFPDGMEYDGLYYLSATYFKQYTGGYENYLSLLSVHETSHQWWSGVVGNDQAYEPWLDESLATYSEYLFIEQYLPGLTEWWWDFRVEEYDPSGRADMTIYDQNELRPYINSVYLQGATFLHELRGALGDEAFFAGLRTYTDTYQSRIAYWDDFVDIMVPAPTDATTAILQDYFNN